MSERSGYAPEVPGWIENWQDDAAATAGFYAGLFGWETDEVAPGAHRCRLRGRDVALVRERNGAAGWVTCVWVDDVEVIAARATANGGRVLGGDGGVLAFADPAGAVMAAWEPREHRGAELVNEPGAWSWSQLLTDDPEGAKDFYGAVFGWKTSAFGALTMWHVPGYVGGEPAQPVPRDVVAGMAPGAPPQWRIDFWVADTDAAVAAATDLGGSVVTPAHDMPIARQAVLADPGGAQFSVSQITR